MGLLIILLYIDRPSEDNFRSILYSHEIGYKKIDGKLYVRRFYRIPMLLFPKELQMIEDAHSQDFTKKLFNFCEQMNRDIYVKYGSKHPWLYHDPFFEPLEQKNFGEENARRMTRRQSLGLYHYFGGILGTIDATEKYEKNKEINKEKEEETNDDISYADIFADSDIDTEQNLNSVVNSSYDFNKYGLNLFPIDKYQVETSEWKQVLEKYIKSPKTSLERDRQMLLKNTQMYNASDAEDEADAYVIGRASLEDQLIVRARLAREYEKKEADRRHREWGRRKLKTQKALFTLSLPQVD